MKELASEGENEREREGGGGRVKKRGKRFNKYLTVFSGEMWCCS